MLNQTFLAVLPFILIAIALAFDNIVFAFFGGLSAIFAGLFLLNTLWLALIFLGIGMYFILIAVLSDWEE